MTRGAKWIRMLKSMLPATGGMVGSAIVRNLEQKGYVNIIGRTSKEP